MDKKIVKSIQNRTKAWAVSHGFSGDVEDMSQHVLFRLSQNRKAPVERICIDYVRSVYGRTGLTPEKNHKAKSNERLTYSEIKDDVEYKEIVYYMDNISSEFTIFQNHLKPKERAIVTLRFKWGLSNAEIADCFGISECLVSLKLKEIRGKLREIIEKNKTID